METTIFHTSMNERFQFLRPKTTEQVRRKTGQVFTDDSYCYVN
jgi:hypothetical protein